jgi:3-hydroxyacyl-CoA dehydrogenase
MPDIVTLTRQGPIGIIALDNPPVNALSHALRVELCERLAEALAAPGIEAIVLRCEGRTFVAGADIREFGREPRAPDVPEVVEFVGQAQKPLIAAIHGTALGGGLELALACHFRLAAVGAKLGFPEVSLGILPGAGGTQRLPRLVGIPAALELIVGGLPVTATRAHELGLVDAVVHGDVKAAAIAFAGRIIDERRPPRAVSSLALKLDEPHFFEEFEARIRERFRGQLAPFHCIRAVRAAAELPFSEGLRVERELFAELMASPQAKALRHAFFAEREVMKPAGLPSDTPLRPIKSAAIVGAGNVGTTLAICFADAHIPVNVLDTSRERLEGGLAIIRRHYESAVDSARLDRAEMEARLSQLRPTLSHDDLATADLVVEAVFEDVQLKRDVFGKLDAICKPGAVLATTTSSLDVEEIASATQRPEDVLGIHLADPAGTLRVVETARTRRTAPDVVASVCAVSRALGKLAISVAARPGFIGSRMLSRQFREALCLLEEGAPPERVDRVLCEFGFPLGPFARAECDPEIRQSLPALSQAHRSARRTIGDDEIVERCLFALINEGACILDEGVAARPLDIDVLWIHGYGFPAHRGGPMFYADELGLSRVHRTILDFQERLEPANWVPSRLLERLSRNGSGFYGTP